MNNASMRPVGDALDPPVATCRDIGTLRRRYAPKSNSIRLDIRWPDSGRWSSMRYKETKMQKYIIGVAALGLLALGGCAKKQVAVAAPPPPPGAVAGSVAADRDGDGIIDGYYSADGIYHPNYTPPPTPTYAPVAMRRGERG
jgi:hypothetical protein